MDNTIVSAIWYCDIEPATGIDWTGDLGILYIYHSTMWTIRLASSRPQRCVAHLRYHLPGIMVRTCRGGERCQVCLGHVAAAPFMD